MANKLTWGIIALLIVSGVGTGIYLSQEQADVSSICVNTSVIAAFQNMSKTNVTGYWYENGTRKQAVCKGGPWIDLNFYLKINNLTLKDISIQPLQESQIDELGNPIINGTTIIVDKSGKINIEGKTYDIKCDGCDKPPATKCFNYDKSKPYNLSDCMK